MKLVRDGIPALVAAKGETEPFRQVADDAEHDRLLDAKLDEELGEWREEFDPHELADLVAVIRDTATRRHIGWKELLEMEQTKRDRYGGFLGGVVWLGHKRQHADISDRERAVLDNPELLASIRRGMADAAAGRVRPWRELTHKVDQLPDAERARETMAEAQETSRPDGLSCLTCDTGLRACMESPPCCRRCRHGFCS